MEARGLKPKPEADKRAHHDAARADTNHPTRANFSCFPKGSESGGFQGLLGDPQGPLAARSPFFTGFAGVPGRTDPL